MSTPKQNTYLDLADPESGGGHQITLWWSETQPERIHLIFTDPRLVDGDGEKPGLRLVFSSNPKSADYSPANFNRLARLLKAEGKPAPEVVEEHPRHLRYRHAVIETVTGAPGSPVGGKSTPVPAPPVEEAEICTDCWCYVVDVAKHQSAVHAP